LSVVDEIKILRDVRAALKAEPGVAKINPHFDEKESLIAFIIAVSPVFL
jgi:hypothetical protein